MGEYSQYSSVVECLAVHEVLSLISSTWVREKDFGAIDLWEETLNILLYCHSLLVSFNLHEPSNWIICNSLSPFYKVRTLFFRAQVVHFRVIEFFIHSLVRQHLLSLKNYGWKCWNHLGKISRIRHRLLISLSGNNHNSFVLLLYIS